MGEFDTRAAQHFPAQCKPISKRCVMIHRAPFHYVTFEIDYQWVANDSVTPAHLDAPVGWLHAEAPSERQPFAVHRFRPAPELTLPRWAAVAG